MTPECQIANDPYEVSSLTKNGVPVKNVQMEVSIRLTT